MLITLINRPQFIKFASRKPSIIEDFIRKDLHFTGFSVMARISANALRRFVGFFSVMRLRFWSACLMIWRLAMGLRCREFIYFDQAAAGKYWTINIRNNFRLMKYHQLVILGPTGLNYRGRCRHCDTGEKRSKVLEGAVHRNRWRVGRWNFPGNTIGPDDYKNPILSFAHARGSAIAPLAKFFQQRLTNAAD